MQCRECHFFLTTDNTKFTPDDGLPVPFGLCVDCYSLSHVRNKWRIYNDNEKALAKYLTTAASEVPPAEEFPVTCKEDWRAFLGELYSRNGPDFYEKMEAIGHVNNGVGGFSKIADEMYKMDVAGKVKLVPDGCGLRMIRINEPPTASIEVDQVSVGELSPDVAEESVDESVLDAGEPMSIPPTDAQDREDRLYHRIIPPLTINDEELDRSISCHDAIGKNARYIYADILAAYCYHNHITKKPGLTIWLMSGDVIGNFSPEEAKEIWTNLWNAECCFYRRPLERLKLPDPDNWIFARINSCDELVGKSSHLRAALAGYIRPYTPEHGYGELPEPKLPTDTTEDCAAAVDHLLQRHGFTAPPENAVELCSDKAAPSLPATTGSSVYIMVPYIYRTIKNLDDNALTELFGKILADRVLYERARNACDAVFDRADLLDIALGEAYDKMNA